ncbi:MAG: hypothetical protein JNM80_06865 [Phycisphaerae bacterium]|nr:hypothetical protein [Phycisphaerae bacterium]
MLISIRVVPCVLLATSAASDVNGQVVFDKVRVNDPQGPSPVYYGETDIALSRTNQNEFIAAVLCGLVSSYNSMQVMSRSHVA